MNEIECGRLLAAAATLDPKFPQSDERGFIRRLWTKLLAAVPVAAGERALEDYYCSSRYLEKREPISPADIVQYWNARRRPNERERAGVPRTSERTRPAPPADPEVIRAGVDRCFAAMAERRALAAGSDPEEAALVAESESAARRSWRSVPCPVESCHAAPGQPCTTNGKPMTKSPCHPARMDAAFNAVTVSSP